MKLERLLEMDGRKVRTDLRVLAGNLQTAISPCSIIQEEEYMKGLTLDSHSTFD